MSQDLESIVRPFQTSEITPSKTYYAPGQIGTPNVILRIGRGGSGKTMTGSYSYSASFYMTKYETERKKPLKGEHHSQFVGKFGQGTVGNPTGGSTPPP